MDAASLAAVSIVARWCALCSPGTPSAHTKRQGWYVDIWSREREQDRLQIVPNVCIVYRDGVSESQLDAVGGHSPVLPERLFQRAAGWSPLKCDAVAIAVQVRQSEVVKIENALRFEAERLKKTMPTLLFAMVNKSSGERLILQKNGIK